MNKEERNNRLSEIENRIHAIHDELKELRIYSYYLEYDAKYHMYIGKKVFLHEYLETNEIHEISEDEFRNKFNELSERCNALSMSMLDRCKTNLIK